SLLRAALRLTPEAPALIMALGRVKAEAAARVDQLIATAAEAAKAGDTTAAIHRYGEAAAVALDPRPSYALLADTRYRAVASPGGVLRMAGIGAVAFTSTPACIRLSRSGRPP